MAAAAARRWRGGCDNQAAPDEAAAGPIAGRRRRRRTGRDFSVVEGNVDDLHFVLQANAGRGRPIAR